MNKSKKGKVVQMLTPENYIRKKARTLPLYECLVASDWEETKMTSVVIARQHTNGNITVCSYVVDLGCLGVKDTMFLFNVPTIQYNDFKENLNARAQMTEVEYALAHNIILASVEYAEEFGFKPCKEYESITKFMLEEDTDEIELIEIECGVDGKPLYVQGPFEDSFRAHQIIAQLEKTAGSGNYNFILRVGDEFEDDDDEDYELGDLLEDDDFEEMTLEEKRELFLTFSNDTEWMKEEQQSTRLLNLVDSIVDDLVDMDQYESFYDQLCDELDIEVLQDEIPDQLLGIHPGNRPVSQELKEQFLDLYYLCINDPVVAKKELKLFKAASNDIPGVYFLELLMLESQQSRDYEKRLEEYAHLYPDYQMIQLSKAIWQLKTMKNPQDPTGLPFHNQTYFADRESIHAIEWGHLLVMYVFATGNEMNINRIQAFGDFVNDTVLSPEIEKILLITNSAQKLAYVFKYFGQ